MDYYVPSYQQDDEEELGNIFEETSNENVDNNLDTSIHNGLIGSATISQSPMISTPILSRPNFFLSSVGGCKEGLSSVGGCKEGLSSVGGWKEGLSSVGGWKEGLSSVGGWKEGLSLTPVIVKERLRIFTFSWNTESVRIGESLSREILEENRKSYFGTHHFACETPDFFPALIHKILDSRADLVVLSAQESACPGDYFNSHFLPEEMPKYGYTLLKRTKMIGVGITTYKALRSFDFKLRGLRISIYVRSDLAHDILAVEDTLEMDIGNSQKEYVCTSMFTRNKGGTVSYVRVPAVGTFAFINSHLPFHL